MDSNKSEEPEILLENLESEEKKIDLNLVRAHHETEEERYASYEEEMKNAKIATLRPGFNYPP